MKKFFSLITALVLCTAMWGASKVSQTLYKVEGALYQGLNENFTGGQNIFVPNDSAVVFTSFDGQPADWYRSNSLQEGGKGTPSFTFQKGFGDYAPIQIRNYTGYGINATKTKIDYIYGKASATGTSLSVGNSTMNMMSMANGYYFRTEDSATTTDIGKCWPDNKTANTYKSNSSYGTYMMYGTDFTHSKYGAVQAYEMVLENPGEMYIDYVVLPIFGYPKTAETTINKMIPEGKTVTLELYSLSKISKDADGKYSYTKESTPVATMTVDNKAYTQDATSGYSYRGTLKFELENPVLLTTSFVARLTWADGCNFGLITDYYNLQNYTTWYIFESGRTTMWTGGGYNSSISYHATFPTLDKKDTKTAFNFASTGGSDNVAFMSNIDPAKTEDFTIDFGGAEWISKTGITYSGGTYKKSGTNTLTFAVEANTGEAREATITLKHHGKVLTYTVSQEAAPAPVEPTYLYLKAGDVNYMTDGAVVYLYSWGGSSEADWSKFELIQNETTAKASMMKDRTGMKIVRFASGTTTPSWQGTIWNQTGDIAVSSDFPEKVDMIELSAWDGAKDATWSKYGGAVEKPKHDYTITAYLPAFCDDIAAYADSVRVMGGFDDWSNGIWMEEKIDEDFNEYWYAEIKDVEEDTEFKLRFGTDADWKVQVQLNGANMANEAFGETTDIVLHYDGEGYGFAACPAPVARKEFVFVAGEAADSDPALFAITWGKDGSNETVKLANKADDIYTAEILETVDSLVLVRCASGATEIIWDGEGKNVWNQTANYALCDTMYFESWVPETNLFAVTCEAPKPVETKYYAKNNWNGAAADDWSWLEMSATDQENIYMLDSVVFGGTGVNINTKEDDTDALYFAADSITVLDGLDGLPGPIPPEPRKRDTIPYAPAHSGVVLEAPQLLAGDTIKLFFNAADSTLEAAIVGRPAPAPRKEFTFIAGEAADSDPALFAITWGKDGSNETVKLANKADDIYTAEILETVDSLVLVRCASGAAEIIWDGEGKNVWNQTANYALCDTMYFESWVPETNLFAVTCEAPKPVEVKYYLRNNWNGAAEWSWKEMTKKEEAYVLDSVIFGGTGVNLNTKEDDADAVWFDLDKLTYNEKDTIQTLDTVRFELSVSEKDTVLKAILLGRPAPAPRKEFTFIAGEAADSDPALFAITWGKDGSNETVKLANKADDIYTAEVLETVDSLVLVRCASGAAEIIWDGEGKNVWNQTANYELCDTMYFESWVPETNLFTLTCEAPKPVEVKYYVTGNAALVGEEKAWQADAIEMVDYTHTFPMLAAGEYQLKVTDGTWEHAWGYDNLSPTVAVEGLYTDVDGNICFTVYTPNDVTVTFAQGYVVVTGDFTNPTPATPDFGLLVNGTDYLPGTPEDKDTYTEYAVNKQLTVGEFVQLYDNVNKAAWTVTPEGSGFTDFDIHDNAYYIKQAGLYQFYIKIPKEGMESGLYVGFQGSGTGLNNVKAQDGKRYNILGQPVNETYRGIVIMNGQTYLQ